MILIKGAGDLASGVAVRLFRSGFRELVMTDLPFPTAIRRTVSFCPAIIIGEAAVEDVGAMRIDSVCDVEKAFAKNCIAVIADPSCACLEKLRPKVLIDAVLAKHNTGTRLTDAPFVLALGPGFTAGTDCHAVIETSRGHDLGRVYYSGSAAPNTGVPGNIGGYTSERILRAPCDGLFTPLRQIGDMVSAGEAVATVNGEPMTAQIGGVLRGILTAGCVVHKNMKSGDIDPRGIRENCFTVSDKARSLGGAVLEALLHAGIFP